MAIVAILNVVKFDQVSKKRFKILFRVHSVGLRRENKADVFGEVFVDELAMEWMVFELD